LRVAIILLRHSAERAPLRYFAKFGALRGKWLRHVRIVEALKRLLALAAVLEKNPKQSAATLVWRDG
jgi:hypothetical protein